MSKSTPVISLVGWSGSGKTTFLEQVVSILSGKGLRVGVIKHHAHTSTVDAEGKDSWRYSQVGANPVIVSSVCEYAIIRKVPVEKTLDQLASQIEDECDVILTEGYRLQAKFIIEFMRTEYRADAIFAHSDIRALVCDSEDIRTQARSAGVPAFALDDFEGLAAFIISVCAERTEDGITI